MEARPTDARKETQMNADLWIELFVVILRIVAAGLSR
jgi:hypothetical protein